MLVTHKLGEVIAHADRVTVMRAGKTVATADPRTISVPELTQMIVGSSITEVPAPSKEIGAPILTVAELKGARADGHVALTGASFSVRAGEIYGIAGVGGNGQTELAEILMGVLRPLAGRIDLAGADDVTAEGPQQRRAQGIAFIPADRHTWGLSGGLSVAENFAVSGVLSGKYGSPIRIDARAIRAATRKAVEAFDVQGVRGPAPEGGASLRRQRAEAGHCPRILRQPRASSSPTARAAASTCAPPPRSTSASGSPATAAPASS